KQLNLDYLRTTGQTVEAAGAEIEKKYGDLQKRLLATGDTEGAGLLGGLNTRLLPRLLAEDPVDLVLELLQLSLGLLDSHQLADQAGAEIEKKYGDLQKRLLATGDTEGAG
ncbi:hypothetical protein ACV331_34450, partial [Pseudomonas aeruginosa]